MQNLGIDVVATGSKQRFCAFHARQVEAKKNNEWWKRHADKKVKSIDDMLLGIEMN